MGTRIRHADTDKDSDSHGIRTETNMAPLTYGGKDIITEVLSIETVSPFIFHVSQIKN